MLTIEKYAAIDIGSNAIRLLIATFIEKEGEPPHVKKTSLVRVPIRLGADVFQQGKISEASYLRMLDAMNAFCLVMKVHNVKSYRACATSAMREAGNGHEIAERIKKETGLPIHIIDGNEEASLIALTDLKTLLDMNKVFLYVDVGGGSTEFTVFASGKTVASRSFKLGTVRLINNNVSSEHWSEVKDWISENTSRYDVVSLIGSGGNINSIYKGSGMKLGKPLTYFYLSNFYEEIKSLSYQDRIFEYNMNEDRADVIIPATRIYLSAMKWSNARDIYVPKIGLSDGIVRSLYQEHKAKEMEVNN